MSQSQETREEESSRGLGPVWWLGLLLAGAWVYPRTPISDWILCPFRWLTELRCPGCGMTRSVTAFVRGDWLSAWSSHPAGPLLLLGLAIFGGVRLADRLAGRTVLSGVRTRWKRIATPVYVGLIVLLLLFWAGRLYVDVFGGG